MKDDRENELYERLKRANNVDEVRAILDTLSQRGYYDERKVLLALQHGQGKITGETKFGIKRERILELEENPMETLKEEETAALRRNLSRLTGEKEYPTSLQIQSRSASQSESNKWKEDAAAHAGNLDSYILSQILDDDDVDRMQLQGSISYGYEYGKGSQDGLLIALSKAVQKGQISVEDMQTIANKSGLSNKYPWLEFISEKEVMDGSMKFKLKDGKEYSYFEAIDKIWKEHEKDASDKRIANIGSDLDTHIIMETLLEKGTYIPQRQGKILTSPSNVKNTDHDHGASMQGLASVATVMTMSHTSSDGTGPRTKQGVANDFARDIGIIKLAHERLKQAEKVGTRSEIKEAKKRLKNAVTRAIARSDTFFDKETAEKWNGSKNLMTLSEGDFKEQSPNTGGKTLGDILEAHNALLRKLSGDASAKVTDKRISKGKSTVSYLETDIDSIKK